MASNTRHLDFWVNTVTFSVENCLFRVPREPFQRESKFFRDKFSSLQGDGGEVEGLSDEKPIRLDGVKKNDFEQLLKVLFRRTHTLLPDLSLNTEQWTSILKLSTAWSFQEPRQTAIDALTNEVCAVNRVVLAQKYNLEELLLPALNELVQRPKPITMEEAVQMGLGTGFKLASFREEVAIQRASKIKGKNGRKLGGSMQNSFVANCSGNSPLQVIDFSDRIRVAFGLSVGPPIGQTPLNASQTDSTVSVHPAGSAPL
ncbi:hypothetical protein EDC04DRAFT_2091870 [Pisolithus marmoratus]|nr:hypothetical protein EDC04DRAFT_2091870 [Pisolithus marmoratus]